jgi:hypothetical protein
VKVRPRLAATLTILIVSTFLHPPSGSKGKGEIHTGRSDAGTTNDECRDLQVHKPGLFRRNLLDGVRCLRERF